MQLGKKVKGLIPFRQREGEKKVRRLFPVTWWKLVCGIALIGAGIPAGAVYLNDNKIMIMGVIAAAAIASGLFLVRQSFRAGEAGFSFGGDGKKGPTGRENAIILFAKRNPTTSLDVPVIIKFVEVLHPPIGARLHYLRNKRKHYYELFNNTKTKHLELVVLKDKKSFPPGLFQLPAAMQPYKDALEYSPPTMMQKVAPGIILIGMVIVGILMVMTGG